MTTPADRSARDRTTGEDIVWRRATEADFPLLREWLEHDYVARWWHHETSAEAVARDFGPSARGEEPSQDWLALRGARPFGLVQRCRVADYPEYAHDLAGIVAVPAGAAMLDYLIGDPAAVGCGLGPAMIAAMAAKTWREWADATAIVVPVVAANRRSWRALEKAGFTRVGEGDLEPDNPIDEPLHYVYRLDRPSGSSGCSGQ
ncbi:GNAT family N-acetyltransferase [Uniformispora flossi]|uniref:GNAT family N-acetyltransferase n=1 Tax=Uniformispora flossi TaxID=3390723 RepID=UPI003C2D274E